MSTDTSAETETTPKTEIIWVRDYINLSESDGRIFMIHCPVVVSRAELERIQKWLALHLIVES